MNQTTKQLQALTKRLHKTKTGAPAERVLHPMRDWMVGVFVGVCIAAVITVWSGYMYIINRDGGATDIEVAVANPTYQATLIDQALEIYNQRAETFATLQSTVVAPVSVDPVIVPAATTSAATTTTETTDAIVGPTTVETDPVLDDEIKVPDEPIVLPLNLNSN